MLKKFSLTLLISSLLIISACSSNDTQEKNDTLTIQTTLYPLEYIIDQIGGDLVNVETIYPPGVDAHTYEPTSKEITELARTDAFVYLGAGMEGFADKAASALENQEIALIEVGADESLFSPATEEEDHDDEHEDEHQHGDFDPHIWLDPLRMNQMADILLAELIDLAPENKSEFNENAAGFKENMFQLDKDFKSTLKDKTHKQILVTHSAYGYWEDSYQIEQLSISGLSTSDEPSQKQLAEIARLAKELEIEYVIYGQNDANKTAEIIQDHIGADKLFLHNLSVLTEDDIERDADYISLMRENLDVLDQATH